MAKMYKDDFTNERRLAWARSKSQAAYRQEQWNLTFSDFCLIWNTEQIWRQRGRSHDSLVLTRLDPEQPWQRGNVCLLRRRINLIIKNARAVNKDVDHMYKEAIIYE